MSGFRFPPELRGARFREILIGTHEDACWWSAPQGDWWFEVSASGRTVSLCASAAAFSQVQSAGELIAFPNYVLARRVMAWDEEFVPSPALAAEWAMRDQATTERRLSGRVRAGKTRRERAATREAQSGSPFDAFRRLGLAA